MQKSKIGISDAFEHVFVKQEPFLQTFTCVSLAITNKQTDKHTDKHISFANVGSEVISYFICFFHFSFILF